jgi:predicted dehydrogenase
LTVQLLRAQGCTVIGIDMDSSRLKLAEQFGAVTFDASQPGDPSRLAERLTNGHGVDGVIIAASTKSSDPVSQAAALCRKRGRIVLVGVTGLELSRADFYEKELSFQVSCSYGPGRYDSAYEAMGQDYPVGFVRWTEQRNMQAVLELMSSGALNVAPLVSYRCSIDEAAAGYKKLEDSSVLGIVLEYPEQNSPTVTVELKAALESEPVGDVRCVFLGAGNYASRTLIPAFKAAGANLDTIVSLGGTSASLVGEKFGFTRASSNEADSICDDQSNTVVIATTHNEHARQVVSALTAGKHVYVEKPLALTSQEVDDIEKVAGVHHLMVGFNRRFSPLTTTMKSLLANSPGPKTFIMTMNAGAVAVDHWIQDADVGGGRIVGEACHYIDLMRFLADSAIKDFTAVRIGNSPADETPDDKATITLSFGDGSIGTIHYFANGSKAFPKERIEVFSQAGVLQIDNFTRLKGYGWPGFRGQRLLRQDKGHAEGVRRFVDSVSNGNPAPIPLNEIIEVARLSIEIAGLLKR